VLVRDLLAGVNDGDTVTLVSQGGASPGSPRTFDVVYRLSPAKRYARSFTHLLTTGWRQFLEAHRLEVGQVVVCERLERRGGRVVLGTRIFREFEPPGGGLGVPRAPPTRPGRLRVGRATPFQSLTIQFVNDMLSGVNHGDKIILVGAGSAGGAAPLTFDVAFSAFILTTRGNIIEQRFRTGSLQFVKAHALKAGQVVDFECVGRRGGRLVLRVRRIIRNPVHRPR